MEHDLEFITKQFRIRGEPTAVTPVPTEPDFLVSI